MELGHLILFVISVLASGVSIGFAVFAIMCSRLASELRKLEDKK